MRFNEATNPKLIIEDETFYAHVAEYLETCYTSGVMFECERMLRALATSEGLPKARALHGVAAGMNGDFRYALDELTKIRATGVALTPREGWFEWNMGFYQLGLGLYKEGWANYEWGKKLGTRPVRQMGDEWDGSFLGPDKVLSVWTEQGFGDTIQFLRFLRQIKERSGARIMFECQPVFTHLLRKQPKIREWVDWIVPLESESPPMDFHAHVALMSLPFVYGLEDEDSLRCEPYLESVPDMAENARQMLSVEYGADGFLKAGLVWAGSTRHRNNAQRSIPVQYLGPFGQILGVKWFSLQTEVKGCPEWAVDFGKDIKVWLQTVAIISALDLVVTCDTAVAHIAGAMGKKTLMMIPKGPCWRWKTSGRENYWYDSVTIYRQPALGDWESVVRAVSGDIERLAVDMLDADSTSAHLDGVAAALSSS